MPNNNKKYLIPAIYAKKLANLSCFSISTIDVNNMHVSVQNEILNHNIPLIEQSLTILSDEKWRNEEKNKIINTLHSYIQADKTNPWIKVVGIVCGVIVGIAFVAAIPIGLSFSLGISIIAAIKTIPGLLVGAYGTACFSGFFGSFIAQNYANNKNKQKIKITEEALQKLVNTLETDSIERSISQSLNPSQETSTTSHSYITPANFFNNLVSKSANSENPSPENNQSYRHN